MMFAVSTAVFSSAYSFSYCLLSRMGLLLGISIVLPSLSTSLLFILSYYNPSSSPLSRPSSIPRYGYVLPNHVEFVVSSLFNVASTSFKCLLSMVLHMQLGYQCSLHNYRKHTCFLSFPLLMILPKIYFHSQCQYFCFFYISWYQYFIFVSLLPELRFYLDNNIYSLLQCISDPPSQCRFLLQLIRE